MESCLAFPQAPGIYAQVLVMLSKHLTHSLTASQPASLLSLSFFLSPFYSFFFSRWLS